MVLSMPILLDTLWHLTCKWTFPLLQSIFVQCSRSPISRVLSPMSVMVGNASQGSVLASFSVFFARDDGVSDVAAPVNTIPFPLLVTFSQPLSADLSSSHFTLVNCAVSSISMLNPTLARVMLMPFLRSDFSVILSTGVLTSSAGASNTAAAAVFPMTSAVLSTHLQSVLYNMIGVRVRYGYEALVFCTRTVEDVPPSSCDALRADPFARSRNITEGETIVPLMGFELGTTYFVWCCAEESLGVQPTNSLCDTRLEVATGWLDCPVVDGNVCNGHGNCFQGQRCMCDAGFYGAGCTDSCPGLLSVNATAFVECGGHGRCGASNLQCWCDDSFVTESCQLPLLTQHRPASPATAYLYLYLELQNLTQSSFTFPQQRQRERVVTALASFFGVESSRMGVSAWVQHVHAIYVEFNATVASQKLEEATTSLFAQKLETSLLGVEGISAVGVSRAFLMRSNQTDPFFCYDGMQNEDETDVDCGGSICSWRCQRKQRCKMDRDCEEGLCSDGLCLASADKYHRLLALILVLVACILLSVLSILCYCCAHAGSHRKRLPVVSPPVVPVSEELEKRCVASAPDRSANRKCSVPDLAYANVPTRRLASPGRDTPAMPFPLTAVARDAPCVLTRGYSMSTAAEELVLESDLSSALDSNLELLPRPSQTDSSSSSNRDGVFLQDVPSLLSSVEYVPPNHGGLVKHDHLCTHGYAHGHSVVASSARERVGVAESHRSRGLHRVPVSEGGLPLEAPLRQRNSVEMTGMVMNNMSTGMVMNNMSTGMNNTSTRMNSTTTRMTTKTPSTGIAPSKDTSTGATSTGIAPAGRQLHRVVVELEETHRPIVMRAAGARRPEGTHGVSERQGPHEPLRPGLAYVNPNEREMYLRRGSGESAPLAAPTVSVKPVVSLTQLNIDTEWTCLLITISLCVTLFLFCLPGSANACWNRSPANRRAIRSGGKTGEQTVEPRGETDLL